MICDCWKGVDLATSLEAPNELNSSKASVFANRMLIEVR